MNEPAAPAPSSGRASLLCGIAVLVAVLAHLAAVFAPRGGELLDGHSFRQLQTALTAQAFQLHGYKLAYETPVLGPPWSIPLEFPLYPAAVAALSSATGWPLESCGPLVSLAAFYAALLGGVLVLRRLAFPPAVPALWVALMLTSPLYTFYGRHFMIETTAVAFGVWFLYTLQRALAGAPRWWFAAALVGTLAALAKTTTFLPFGLAAVLLTLQALRPLPAPARRATFAAAAAAALVIGAVAIAWLLYSDALKARNPVASFLTSANLREFNFGTWPQRLTAEFWAQVYERIAARTTAEATLFLCLPLLWLATPALRRGAAWLALLFFAPVLTFANLYFVHDYYFLANGLFLLAALAAGLGALAQRDDWPLGVRASLIAAALLAHGVTTWRTFGINYVATRPEPPVMAQLIKAATGPQDAILAFGYDWNSALPYYAQRRALMLPRNFEHRQDLIGPSLQLLGDTRIGALVMANEFRDRDLFARPYLEQLGLAPTPIAVTSQAKLYLRRDLIAGARQILPTLAATRVTLNLSDDPTHDAAPEPAEDLTTSRWQGQLTMSSPAPFRLRGRFEMNLADIDGGRVMGVHAPSDLLFAPPAGARRIRTVVGMVPASYSGTDHTDGIVVELWIEPIHGEPRLLAQRSLQPASNSADRGNISLDATLDRPLQGTVVLRFGPGPAGQVNYDWCFVRSVRID
jgi:hypothetical protein